VRCYSLLCDRPSFALACICVCCVLGVSFQTLFAIMSGDFILAGFQEIQPFNLVVRSSPLSLSSHDSSRVMACGGGSHSFLLSHASKRVPDSSRH
jgi:hypothetical protein